MKVTIIRKRGKNETITRHPVEDIALFIWRKHTVTQLREMYNLILKERQPDGQILTNWASGIKLERLCFAQEFDKYKSEHRILGYNGLVVVEVNNLPTYEKAVEVRDLAKKMPETLMCFLGASGKSVKIVCRGELYPEMGFNPGARPFYADTQKHDVPQPVSISRESDRLMPGRTVKRTYRLEWLFIIDTTLGHYFELPDEDRLETLLMQIATRCLNQGIPLAFAQGMTMEHPVLNTDKLLLKKTFETVYAVTLQEDYMKKHKIKPLQSIPKDTLQMMKTEIFLNENFEMRKNLMTGVAEYREKYSNDQNFKPLTEEVRNDMTMRATELGLKSWDRDVNRFIDSTRIEQYDPVNTWLNSLPQWNGHDYIKELAARVPTSQPHWEKYLRMWLIGMVAQWRESDKQLTGNALTPLLIGRQGCGKTRFCKIILPPELRDYYNDKINFKNEFDLNIALTMFAMINIDEFDKTTASQQIVLKYLLSSAEVKFRPPYGKTIKQFRRYTSFIGTTNQQKPLVDPTGSRRFVCVSISNDKNIDFEDNVEHHQLFAQALHLLNSGERYWLDNEEIATLIKENEPYQKLNDLVEMIGETFTKPKAGEGRWWSLTEIHELLKNRYANYDPKTTFQKLGRALSDMKYGFETDRKTSGHIYKLLER